MHVWMVFEKKFGLISISDYNGSSCMYLFLTNRDFVRKQRIFRSISDSAVFERASFLLIVHFIVDGAGG